MLALHRFQVLCLSSLSCLSFGRDILASGGIVFVEFYGYFPIFLSSSHCLVLEGLSCIWGLFPSGFCSLGSCLMHLLGCCRLESVSPSWGPSCVATFGWCLWGACFLIGFRIVRKYLRNSVVEVCHFVLLCPL